MSFSSSRLAILATAAFAVTVAATSAEAQNRRAIPRAQADGQARAAQAQYDNGVRDGLREGRTDARRGDRFGFSERAWQRGSAAFRQGFEAGYRRAYEIERRGGYVGRGGNRGYGGRGSGRYGGGGYGAGRSGAPTYANPATAAGYNDGYEQGLEDARDGDRFDPIRSKDYREADNDYDRRFGTKAQWQVAYREGFRSGYEQGYRAGYRR
ncbi:MAG: hypothetical protein WD690_11565 [Vicinamibacterales bacterium]